ncbi:MAG: [Fe-Fe] hydrogenase large subunit C-terminal domain-containing protein [Bifidobacterium pseudocatenulatum]
MNSNKVADLEAISFTGIRGVEAKTTVTLGEREVKIAVVNGSEISRRSDEKIQSGELYYDFIGSYGMPEGCITGGGQPVPI